MRCLTISALYGTLEHNMTEFLNTTTTNTKACMSAGTFRNTKHSPFELKFVEIVTGLQVFRPIVFLITE